MYNMQGICQAGTVSELIQSSSDLIIAQQAPIRDGKASADQQTQKLACSRFGKVLEGVQKMKQIDKGLI